MATAAIQAGPDQQHTYRCQCGHELRFFGGGRHRIYFEAGDTGSADPVMNRKCPACDRDLPGKN